MVDYIKKWSTSQMRGVIRCLLAKDNFLTKFHDEIVSNNSENIMTKDKYSSGANLAVRS